MLDDDEFNVLETATNDKDGKANSALNTQTMISEFTVTK